jgi:hypothetical protein
MCFGNRRTLKQKNDRKMHAQNKINNSANALI